MANFRYGCKCGGDWVMQMITVYPRNGDPYQKPGAITCSKCGTPQVEARAKEDKDANSN